MSDTPARAPRVAVDALGGDHAPDVVVEGAVLASRELGIPVQLVGPGEQLRQTIRGLGAERLGLEVLEAPEAVGMAEKVTRATLKKRSSILVAVERLRSGQADAFFSAGNTAACWTIAKMVLGTLEEVDRPALAAVVPHPAGRTVMLDVGANSNCKARHLEEFAIMGEVFTRELFRIERPRVGLMSVGEEASKGTALTKSVHKVLEASGLNFLGNVEGRDLFSGRADVIVMDGFTGNVVLKACEKLAESIMHLLKEQITRSRSSRLGALLCAGAFRGVKRRIDASQYGGAPLLGMKGCCVIGHGRSNAEAVKHGIRVAGEFFSSGVNQQIEAVLRPLASRKENTEEPAT
jgi:glycerol-3-phosphate acyltransferase PlsX